MLLRTIGWFFSLALFIGGFILFITSLYYMMSEYVSMGTGVLWMVGGLAQGFIAIIFLTYLTED